MYFEGNEEKNWMLFIRLLYTISLIPHKYLYLLLFNGVLSSMSHAFHLCPALFDYQVLDYYFYSFTQAQPSCAQTSVILSFALWRQTNEFQCHNKTKMFASRGPWFLKRAKGIGVFWIQWGIERKSEREREGAWGPNAKSMSLTLRHTH